MDPTDVRRLVRDLAAARGVDPDVVLGRSRTSEAVVARRAIVRELVAEGLSLRQVGCAVGRHWSTIHRIVSGRVATPTAARSTYES